MLPGLVRRNRYHMQETSQRPNTYAGGKIKSMSEGKKYHVTRIKSVLQATTVVATGETEAIEKARKLKRKEWHDIDDKRRKNYKAERVVYPA